MPEDVEGKLGMSLLGVVPKSADDAPDQALLDPKSPISEAYNSLRGSLLYSTPQGLPQIILVTSAQAAEGKTTTSLAIASGFARMGRRVADRCGYAPAFVAEPNERIERARSVHSADLVRPA